MHPSTLPFLPKQIVPRVRPRPCVSVFDYVDYHVFLRDWIEARRELRPSYSYQVLANRAGLKSRSSLRLVVIGEQDLSPSSIARLGNAMDLDEAEMECFVALTAFNNAKDPAEREYYHQRWKKQKRLARSPALSSQYYSLFGKWYILPVWELVACFPFAGDFAELGNRLDPRISPEEARYALNVLLELDLLEAAGDRYAQKQSTLLTKEQLTSPTVRAYQLQTLALVPRALEEVPQDRRHIGTLTIGLDADGWKTLTGLVQEFRQKVVHLASEIESVDRVYQINLQTFPLTGLPDKAIDS